MRPESIPHTSSDGPSSTCASPRSLDTRREVVSLWRKRFFGHRLTGLEELPRPGRLRAFPPEVVVHVRALACEPPADRDQPLSRWSIRDLGRATRSAGGIGAAVSDTTVWRWLHQDAIRPWQHRCWIFPCDPDFAPKAGRVLDLYHRTWQGSALHDNDFVVSADEKTSIQARARRHRTLPTQPGRPRKVEHEYTRCGAWAYLAALDVHRAKLFGCCEARSGIAAFDRLVAQVMHQDPYRQARRVFWIVDNGSAHRGLRSIRRLRDRYPNLLLVHGPVHASWLNRIEIYFSVLQRKALTPNDFASLKDLAVRLHSFERHYEAIAKPFEWRFTRADLQQLLKRIQSPGPPCYELAA